ncbi:MAG TPA: hypothetical protein VHA82_16630 [Ramlibacter sp.]|uniref:hypothetical protein n=1 Tax=Ramlibacter sp. TaxID=1917967 RepID=UPI002B687155|nr:hypothetical protein [Ramlibacter sp.]HVZ45439.1 hypothetical protein [Ramlibacter sp.]
MHPLASTAAYVSLGALVAWRVYSRFRRMVGRQRLSKYRPAITLVIFPVLVALVALASLAHPLNLLWFAAALGCGVALGFFGLAHTRFEAVPGQGLFYTPNAHLGIALSLVFVARIAYRLIEVFYIAPQAQYSATEFARSPLTLSAFGLLAGYYISYAVGLLRWRGRVLRARQAREAGQGNANAP